MVSKCLVILTFVLVMNASCSFSGSVASHPVEYNVAAAEARDKVILLNIIRASQGYPMQFSALSQVRGNLRASASLEIGAALTQPEDALSSSTGTTLQSNPSFDVAVLDSAKFMRGIMTPVSLDSLQTLVDQGWRSRQLAYLLIEEVRLELPDKKAIWALVNDPSEEHGGKFGEYLERALRGASHSSRKRMRFVSKPVHITPRIKDPKVLGRSIVALAGAEASTIRIEMDNKKRLALYRSSSTAIEFLGMKREDLEAMYALFVGPEEAEALVDRDAVPPGVQSSSDPSGEPRFTLVMRSPHGIMIYLAELCKRGSKAPEIRGADGKMQPLFEVLRESKASDTHFSVEFSDVAYSVRAGSEGYRSRRTLSLVAQLLALHQESSELPKTSVVTVTGQ